MTASAVLFYFVKYPQPGKVKTRLAQSVGSERAAEMYRALAERNFSELKKVTEEGVDLCICYDPPEKEIQIKEWLPNARIYRAQCEGDLGKRLADAFDFAFSQGYGAAMVYGSDTLDASANDVLEGFSALKRHDLVLGPAEDGGYYALGLSVNAPDIFQGIPWSTDRVFNETLKKADNLNLTISEMTVLKDMDECEKE